MKKSRQLIQQSRNFIKVILTNLNGKGKYLVWFLPRLPWPTRDRILPLYRAITRLWPSLSARWYENNETQNILNMFNMFMCRHQYWCGPLPVDRGYCLRRGVPVWAQWGVFGGRGWVQSGYPEDLPQPPRHPTLQCPGHKVSQISYFISDV